MFNENYFSHSAYENGEAEKAFTTYVYPRNWSITYYLVHNVFCQGKKKCTNNSKYNILGSFSNPWKNHKVKSWPSPEVLKMSPVLVIGLNASNLIIHSAYSPADQHVLLWKRSTELNNRISQDCEWPVPWLTVWKQIWKFWVHLSSPFCTKRTLCSLFSL